MLDLELMRLKMLEELCEDFKPGLFPMEWLKSTDFFRAPASTKWHAAYSGGLFDHSYKVTKNLVDLTVKLGLQWRRPESPIIIGMLHDATKINTYVFHQDMNPIKQEIETCWEWNKDREELSPIHGLDSVLKVAKVMKLTNEEWACIRWHMGAYETESWSEFDAAIRTYPNVLWTHTADMIASKLQEKALEEGI